MSMDFTAETATEAVVDSFSRTPDPRLRELLTGLVRHLHDFVRETEPTRAEWERAIAFLTEAGHRCDDTRQEFILLSDVLGVSMLVEAINDRKEPAVTDSTVLGPFHMVESPPRALGDTVDLVGGGEPCLISGQVVSVDGTALPGATLDVWQADDQGFYDVQQPQKQPPATAAACSPRTPKGASGSARACRARIRSRRTGRSGRCSRRPAATPTAPPTSTSS